MADTDIRSEIPEWHDVCVIARAAATGDSEGVHVGLVELNRRFPGGGAAKALAGFALRYQLYVRFQRQPEAAELRVLAEQLEPRWSAVIRNADVEVLDDLFAFLSGLRPAPESIRGARLTVLASAALGLVLDNADQDLEEMGPRIARVYDKLVRKPRLSTEQ